MSGIVNNKITKAVAFLGMLLMLTLCVWVSSVYADSPDFSVDVSCDSEYVYDYGGEWFISAGSNGKLRLNYTIRNDSSKTMRFSAIKISETLLDDYDNYKYGTTKYDSTVITIAPGEEYKVTGASFVCSGSSSYSFLYDILAVPYRTDEFGYKLPFTDDDYESIIGDGNVLYVAAEKTSISVDYSFITNKDKIYLDDVITLNISITSSGNVPLQNVDVYDSVYGHLRTINSIRKGSTTSFQTEVNVLQGGDSYLCLEYSVINHAERQTAEFVDKKIHIDVTDFSYELMLDIEPQNWYISDGDNVTFDYTVTNIGTGAVENIVIFDPENTAVAEIPVLAAGKTYAGSVTFPCSPGIDYSFRCISPLTKACEKHIELLLVPDISVICTLDKKLTEYSYMDKAVVTYTLRNNGSVDALNLVLVDVGTNETWDVGLLLSGSTRTITYTMAITKEQTVLSPMLTGIYDDDVSTPINEAVTPVVINVETPGKYVDIKFEKELSRYIINDGDVVDFTFSLTNLGNGELKSYSLSFVEVNKIIASDGILAPADKKVYTASQKMELGKTYTVRLTGRNGDTGEIITQDFPLNIVVHELINKPTPTPAEETALPTKNPEETPSVITDEEISTVFLKFATYVVGGILVLIVIVSIVICVRYSISFKSKRNRR